MVMRANDNDEGSAAIFPALLQCDPVRRGSTIFSAALPTAIPATWCSTRAIAAPPGMYARSFLEGRLEEAQLDKFRREVDGAACRPIPTPG